MDFVDGSVSVFKSSTEQEASSKQMNQAEETKPEVRRHHIYYFHTIVFKVENTLFRVPKVGFEVAGSFFETLFSLPGPGENAIQIDGSDDDHPIVLENISEADFVGFLSVMYPFKPGYPAQLEYHDWVGALNLATMWDFPALQTQAIQMLSTLLESKTTAEKILLAKKYRIKQWLVDGYMTLVIQAERLDLRAMRAIGIDEFTLANLSSIREFLITESRSASTQSSGCCNNCGYCPKCERTSGKCRPEKCSTKGKKASIASSWYVEEQDASLKTGPDDPSPQTLTVDLSLARKEIDEMFQSELAMMEQEPVIILHRIEHC